MKVASLNSRVPFIGNIQNRQIDPQRYKVDSWLPRAGGGCEGRDMRTGELGLKCVMFLFQVMKMF